ncbi:peptidylprolyl isomerase [Aliarcobacter skirrowii]|jgi:peptidyl-prolyl cis-trans isomerase D|uniref:peptidylprolyl isomerase n=1 Tax=Aliarcobacter skirrowii TaxID=28200 RepID=UPI000F672660|nr:peptidylprolyl isomerase [Aliarcobacter skirrowii]AZL54183.1 peptidylprolyl isomerase [Aliarcobacter skirrowii]
MITWMQRHKKWLVITIWISTIAFVGAGFVGWGSYNYGSKGSVVATIGNKEINFEELNKEYSSLYGQYAQLFGDSFNQELAKQLRLEDIALSQLLQKKLLLVYGEDLGLITTDEEIAKEILKYEEFKVDGKFSKDQYVKVLAQNRITPQEFENSLKDTILFQKIQAIFSLNVSDNELENIGKLLFIEDDIEYKILSIDDINLKIDEKMAKEYFEQNSSNYNSTPSFELEIKKYDIKNSNIKEDEILKYYDRFKLDYRFEDGKLKSFEEAKDEVIADLNENESKKEALNLYLKLKKGEENFDSKRVYAEDKIPFSSENIEKILEQKEGDITRPFLEKNSFYIVKVVKKIPSKPLTFEEARTMVYADALLDKKHEALDAKIDKELTNFKGSVVKNINRASSSKIKGLSQDEAQEFLNNLFVTTSKESSIKFDDKAVMFRIVDSRLKNYSEQNSNLVKQEIGSLVENELLTNLLKKLEQKYEIKTYMQNKE